MQSKDKVLLRIRNLKQYFPLKEKGKYVKANDGISIDIYEGETLGLVGESGCGKSTFGRTLLQFYQQTDGRTMYYGRTLHEIAPKYVKDTLSTLEKRRERQHTLQQRCEALRAEHETMDEAARYKHKEALDRAEKDAHDALLDIANLIGGFLVAKDLRPIAEIFLKEYEISVRLREALCAQRECELYAADAEYACKQAGQQGAAADKEKLEKRLARLRAAQETVARTQAELTAVRTEIEAMRAPYATDPEFLRLEQYRDDGVDLARLVYSEMRLLRSDLQLIFQDPYSSLNPRMTVGQIIGEGMLAHRFFLRNDGRMQEETLRVMKECGLAPYFLHRFPHQFSGGQRQRIGIARSLAVRPRFVVCDEAVSALDVSIQSQIINLLQDLKEQANLTYLFITHDLSVVKYISDRIGVMYLGTIVELADAQEIFEHPAHPYTEALLAAIPTTDVTEEKKELAILEGDIPSPVNPPAGCKFHTRCKYCTDICKQLVPEWQEIAPRHFVACHHMLEHTGPACPG